MFSTEPPCSCIDACHTSWDHISGPAQLTEIVLSRRGRSMSIVLPMYGFVAALFTRMSMRPNRSMVAATHAAASSGSPALAACQAASPSIVATAASSTSAFRDEIITRAPLRPNSWAIARPMPREPPVIERDLVVEANVHRTAT